MCHSSQSSPYKRLGHANTHTHTQARKRPETGKGGRWPHKTTLLRETQCLGAKMTTEKRKCLSGTEGKKTRGQNDAHQRSGVKENGMQTASRGIRAIHARTETSKYLTTTKAKKKHFKENCILNVTHPQQRHTTKWCASFTYSLTQPLHQHSREEEQQR